MELYHFYHIYADGNWHEPVHEHAKALVTSGLSKSLNKFYIGISGESTEPLNVFHQYGLKPELVAQEPETWEQLTLKELWKFSKENSGYVLYAHTKSAANYTEINIPWRKDMCFHNVIGWRDCVQYLDDNVDIVGAHYIDEQKEHGPTGQRFFGGNYWWANLEYIRKLPDLSNENRWAAEVWIGQGNHTMMDLCPGWPSMERFHTSW
jgi:hypothetical protein